MGSARFVVAVGRSCQIEGLGRDEGIGAKAALSGSEDLPSDWRHQPSPQRAKSLLQIPAADIRLDHRPLARAAPILAKLRQRVQGQGPRCLLR